MPENDQPTDDADTPRGLTLALASLVGHIVGMATGGAVGAWLVMEALDAPGPTWSRAAFGVGGVLLSVAGLGLGVGGIRRFVSWVQTDAYGRVLEHRARELGLPTDPEAYRDGGLAVAATAFDLEEARIIASALCQADIPAWVEGEAMAAWYWHLRMGLHREGIRVLVPLGRLAEAREVVEQHEQEMKSSPERDTEEDPHYRLRRSAHRLGFLAALGFTAPVALFLALRLLVRMYRERRRTGDSSDLRKGRRLTWAVLVLLIALFVLPVTAAIVVVAIWG